MILGEAEPIKRASNRADWAMPYIYPAQFFPGLEHMAEFMGDYETMRRAYPDMRQVIMNIVHLLVLEEQWVIHSKAKPGHEFRIDSPEIEKASMNPPMEIERQALAYVSWLSSARDVIQMDAHCLHVSTQFQKTFKIPDNFTMAKQNAILHMEGMTFADGSPVNGVHIQWVSDDDNDMPLVQIIASSAPGRWPSPMEATTIMANVVDLLHNPMQLLDVYHDYVIKKQSARPDHLVYARDNFAAIADHIPALLTAWDSMKGRNDMMIDLTIPEPWNEPSMAEKIGSEIMPARAHAEGVRNGTIRYSGKDCSRPIWLLD